MNKEIIRIEDVLRDCDLKDKAEKMLQSFESWVMGIQFEMLGIEDGKR